LIQTIRDEAHRFAVTFHRTRRNAQRLTSELHDIPGIGPKTVEKLLRTLGSMERVRQASDAELSRVVGTAATGRLRKHLSLLSVPSPLVNISSSRTDAIESEPDTSAT
jgi:excinuclease ABC subunit C